MEAYITAISAFLPNAPVENDSVERVLGVVGDLPSRTRHIILRNNKIKSRHYAIDPDTGELTHTNARLTAEAVRNLAPPGGLDLNGIDCLACGTSTPDQLLPGHGVMVHGELGTAPCEVVTTHGICMSGMAALKYAAMNIAAGLAERTVATGSELASSFLRAPFFEGAGGVNSELSPEENPLVGFDADFLRWMLSDGAGAVLLEGRPREDGVNLRVEWIESVSFAGQLETCMYAGGTKAGSGLIGFRAGSDPRTMLTDGSLLIRQDVKLLDREIITTAVDRTLAPLAVRRGLTPEEVDWFLPHYSSGYFRDKLAAAMDERGFIVDRDRWFTNLEKKGNTGSASIYVILEELVSSGNLASGERILCMIPESGRFSMSYMLLTVV